MALQRGVKHTFNPAAGRCSECGIGAVHGTITHRPTCSQQTGRQSLGKVKAALEKRGKKVSRGK